MAHLQVEHLCKTLGKVHTLQDVSLRLDENEFVVVLGPSGCGKSTLFHVIAGLIRPDRGRVLIDSQDFTGQTGRVSYMQQKDLLLPWRSVLDNVSIPLLLKGNGQQEARNIARGYLHDFGLEDFAGYYPCQLSGGMRQRAALLRTYLFASDILLLDEPFAALDAITRRKMHVWLKDLRQHYQSSILFVTHDIEEALVLADRIYLLSARPATVRLEIDLNNSAGKSRSELKAQIIELLEDEDGEAFV